MADGFEHWIYIAGSVTFLAGGIGLACLLLQLATMAFYRHARSALALDSGRLDWLSDNTGIRWPGNVALPHEIFERTSDGWLIDREVPVVGGQEFDTLREAIDAAMEALK